MRPITLRKRTTILVGVLMVSVFGLLLSIASLETGEIDNSNDHRHTQQRKQVEDSTKQRLVVDVIPPSKLTFKPNDVDSSCDTLEVPARDMKEMYIFYDTFPAKRKGTYVYSAFYDNRDQPKVRILGISDGSHPSRFYCQVWYDDDSHVHITTSRYDIIPETHNRKYIPAVFTCDLPRQDTSPYAVSIVESKCAQPTHHLKVVDNTEQTSPKYKFSVCVTPLNLNYSDVNQLVEMVEVNKILGAQQIFLYDYSTSPIAWKYLEAYRKDGLVSVFPWKIPAKVDVWPLISGYEPNIHYFGQLISLNDCLFRNRWMSKYTVMTDLDEFVVPQTVDNWSQMIGEIVKGNDDKHPASFMFMNSFFRKEWTSDRLFAQHDDAKTYNILTLLKTTREEQIFPPYTRSKCIFDPLKIKSAGVHFAHEFHSSQDSTNIQVPVNLAKLHHYRLGFDSNPVKTTVDERIHKFQEKILNSISHRHRVVETPNESLL